MFLQHVRTRLARQRNYFRIYMISHALISDSVLSSGCACVIWRQYIPLKIPKYIKNKEVNDEVNDLLQPMACNQAV